MSTKKCITCGVERGVAVPEGSIHAVYACKAHGRDAVLADKNMAIVTQHKYQMVERARGATEMAQQRTLYFMVLAGHAELTESNAELTRNYETLADKVAALELNAATVADVARENAAMREHINMLTHTNSMLVTLLGAKEAQNVELRNAAQ